MRVRGLERGDASGARAVRLLLAAVLLALAATTLAGCLERGGDVASRIEAAKSPLIAGVRYHGTTIESVPERLTIFLIPEVTEEQIMQAWCEVIVPAGIDQVPADHTSIYRAGADDPEDPNFGAVLLDKPTCPPQASPLQR